MRLERKMTIPFLSFLLLLCGCTAARNKCAPRRARLRSVAVEKYGAFYRTSFNSDRRFAIVRKQEKESALDPNPALQFFVFDMKNGVVVFEDNVGAARVRWNNSRQIEVVVTPGTVSRDRADEIPGYRVDVETGLKFLIPGDRRSHE